MGGLKGFLVGVGAVAVIAVGVLASIEERRDGAPAQLPSRAAPPDSPATSRGAAADAGSAADVLSDTATAIPPAPSDDVAPEPTPPPAAPRFDLVRVEPSGAALVAGTADPGDVIEVLIDRGTVATTTADASGAFVAAFDMPRGGGLRRLDLLARGANGERLSREPVFVSAPDADQSDDAPPVVAQARPEGVALLQAPPRGPEAPVSLDVLSYSPEGAVLMQGRASANGAVRIYADETLIAEAQTSPSGDWTVQGLEGLAPGAYTLRVDEIGTDGQVISRVETPFQRAAASDARLADGQIVVQAGDSLWKLSQQVYGLGLRYTVIYDSNRARIRDPDLIYPGQVLDIPQSAPTP